MKAGQRRSQAGRGKPALVSPEKQDFLVDVIVRRDRANEGMGRAEIITMLETLCPNLSAAQCKQCTSIQEDQKAGQVQGQAHGSCDGAEDYDEALGHHGRAALSLAQGKVRHNPRPPKSYP